MFIYKFELMGVWKCVQESKKFRRLKKGQGDADEDRFGISDEEFDGSGRGGRTAEEKLKRSLFGDDEGIYYLRNRHYFL